MTASITMQATYERGYVPRGLSLLYILHSCNLYYLFPSCWNFKIRRLGTPAIRSVSLLTVLHLHPTLFFLNLHFARVLLTYAAQRKLRAFPRKAIRIPSYLSSSGLFFLFFFFLPPPSLPPAWLLFWIGRGTSCHYVLSKVE